MNGLLETTANSLARSLAHSFHHSDVNLVMQCFVKKKLHNKDNLNPVITNLL